MPWSDNLLDCKLRDDIKIDGTNKALYETFHNHDNYIKLETSTKIEDDLAFLLSLSQADVQQSATATIFRAYLSKTINFRNDGAEANRMDEQTLRQFIDPDHPVDTTAVFDDHASRDGNTFKLGKDLKDAVGIFSSRGTCGGLKACLVGKALELFVNKNEAEELKKIAEGPNSTNTIAAKNAVQDKYRAFYEAVNRGIADAVAAYAATANESTTKCSGMVKSCGVAPNALITPHEWVGHAVKYEAYGKWVDETGCYSWRIQDPKRDACDHFMDAERVLKRFRQTDIPDEFKDANALVEAAYAFKDNEAAAQTERQAIKRQVDELCNRNPRPRRE